MPGLLDYQVDPIAMGLLGAGGALMTPRAQGGGIGAAMQAFPQQMMQGQEMQRRMQEQALRQKALTDRAEMDRKRFGMEEQEFGLKRDEATRKQAEMRTKMEVIQQIRGQIALEKPELLPMFDMDPMKAMERMFPEPAKPQVVAPGAALVSGDREIYRNPDKPPAPLEIQRLIEARNALPVGSPDRKLIEERIATLNYRQPAASMNVSYGAPFAGVDPATGQTMLFQPSNRGGPPQATGLAPPPKPAEQPAENERASAGYAGRMIAAERILSKVGEDGYPTLGRELAANLPLTGGRAAPYVRTEDQQKYKQAQEDWVRAKLRKESGAVIGEQEMADEIRTYFPVPGEPKSVVEQKAQARKQAEAGMRASAGRAPIPDAGAGATRQGFPMLPNARDHDGKIARDQQTGKRYRSTDGRWVEVP